jgi:hypothetical protein
MYMPPVPEGSEQSFVAGEHEYVDAVSVHVEVQVASGLRGVDGEHRTGFVGDLADLPDRQGPRR